MINNATAAMGSFDRIQDFLKNKNKNNYHRTIDNLYQFTLIITNTVSDNVHVAMTLYIYIYIYIYIYL